MNQKKRMGKDPFESQDKKIPDLEHKNSPGEEKMKPALQDKDLFQKYAHQVTSEQLLEVLNDISSTLNRISKQQEDIKQLRLEIEELKTKKERDLTFSSNPWMIWFPWLR